MSTNRRNFIASLGSVAALGTTPGILRADERKEGILQIDVNECKKPKTIPELCGPGRTRLDYGQPPGPTDPDLAVGTVRRSFMKGLQEQGLSGEEIEALMVRLDPYLFMLYAPELRNKVHNNFFQGVNLRAWVTLNDHAFILGQLTVTMASPPTRPISERSFLRAKSKFAEAVSTSRCECFIRQGAFRMPAAVPSWLAPYMPKPGTEVKSDRLQIDDDCVLC